MNWCRKYIGLHYENRGRGPRFDCWGLVWHVLKTEFGVEVPSYANDYADAAERSEVSALIESNYSSGLWQRVSKNQEQPGDIVVLNISGKPRHCGVVVGPGWMLHIEQGINACLERYWREPWKNRVAGIYRWKNAQGKV